ncbi:MAG: hypothetical protein AAB652_01260 [Patescibacteria group bacterium]
MEGFFWIISGSILSAIFMPQGGYFPWRTKHRFIVVIVFVLFIIGYYKLAQIGFWVFIVGIILFIPILVLTALVVGFLRE